MKPSHNAVRACPGTDRDGKCPSPCLCARQRCGSDQQGPPRAPQRMGRIRPGARPTVQAPVVRRYKERYPASGERPSANSGTGTPSNPAPSAGDVSVVNPRPLARAVGTSSGDARRRRRRARTGCLRRRSRPLPHAGGSGRPRRRRPPRPERADTDARSGRAAYRHLVRVRRLPAAPAAARSAALADRVRAPFPRGLVPVTAHDRPRPRSTPSSVPGAPRPAAPGPATAHSRLVRGWARVAPRPGNNPFRGQPGYTASPVPRSPIGAPAGPGESRVRVVPARRRSTCPIAARSAVRASVRRVRALVALVVRKPRPSRRPAASVTRPGGGGGFPGAVPAAVPVAVAAPRVRSAGAAAATSSASPSARAPGIRADGCADDRRRDGSAR